MRGRPPKRSACLRVRLNPFDYSETQAQVIAYAMISDSGSGSDPRIDGDVRPNSTDLITTLFAIDSALSRSQAQIVYPVYSGVTQGFSTESSSSCDRNRFRGKSALCGKPIPTSTMRWFRTPSLHSSPR